MLKFKKYQSSLQVIIIVMLSMAVFLIMIKNMSHGLPLLGDTRFHLGRIYEIREAFSEHQIPSWLNFTSFFSMGAAISGMYPDITLWPLVFITNKLPFFYQIIAIRSIILILTFLVSFLSLQSHNINRVNSFFAAIIYTFSGYSLYQFLFEFQPGAIIIMIFTFPLIFGVIDVLSIDKFSFRLSLKLSILFGIVVYSHILSVVTIAFLIILFWIFKCLIEAKVNWYTVLHMVIATLLTAVYALPIFYRIIKISQSRIAPPFSKGVVNAGNIVDLFANPQIYSRTSLSIVAIILLILVLFKGSINKFVAVFLSAELVLMILCTNLTPWIYLQKIPLINMLQYTPWRFGIWLSSLIILAFLFTNYKHKQNILFMLSLLTLLSIPGIPRNPTPDFSYNPKIYISPNRLVANNIYRNFDTTFRDYLPAKSVGPAIDNKVPSNVEKLSYNQKIYTQKDNSNIKKIAFNSKIIIYNKKGLKGNHYNLPIYYYPSLKYNVKINGSPIKKIRQTKSGFMQLSVDAPLHANSKILIQYNSPKLYNLLLLFSLGIFIFFSLYYLLTSKKVSTRNTSATTSLL